MRILWACLLLALPAAAQSSYDLVIYGGTAGGVATAVAGARHGLKTALLEPRTHIGGMVSGGLSGTDVGKREVIGGLALEFYFRAGRHYDLNRHLQEIAWMPEPKVAEAVFREMLKEAGVTLLERHRLREKTGVVKQNGRVIEIVMENGARFRAKVFADTTYEGDLMAQAKVSSTFGRESAAQYGESLAILGHAAGIAAALAVAGNTAVQDVNVGELQQRLRKEGAVFEHGVERQAEALTLIRQRFAPPPRTGPAPWSRPVPKED